MTLPSLVSFSGFARSGKNSAAEILSTRARFVPIKMSKPMMEALAEVDPWIVDHKENSLERFSDLYENLNHDELMEFEEVRRLLQALSTNVGRNMISENVWADMVFKEIQKLQTQSKSIALSGVRYKNEMDLVRQHDGVCVWIDRPNARPRNSNANHNLITRRDCDLVVMNDGTLKDLYVNIVIALEEFNSNKESDNVG